MQRRHALHLLTGGVLALAGCNALDGGADPDAVDPTTDDDPAPYSDGLTAEFSEDPAMASLRLTNDAAERIGLDVTVTKPNGDRQFDGSYAVDPDEDTVFHDVLAFDDSGETTFDVVVSGVYDDAETNVRVSCARLGVQQEVLVTARSAADVSVSTREMSTGTTPGQ